MFTAILNENRKTLALASPIIAGHVGQMLMNWADTVMLGRVSVTALAACAFANILLSVAMIFGFGVMSAVTVLASRAFGAGRGTEKVYRSGLVLGAGLGTILSAIVISLLAVIDWFGQPAEVNTVVGDYLILTALSIIPVMMATASKGFSESLSKPWPPFWIVLGGVLLNVLLNWLLIFGSLGFPKMGLAGAALATLLARIATLIAMLLYVGRAKYFQPFLQRIAAERSLKREIGDLLRIGLPAGGQYLAEVSAFAAATMMMGWISVDALAAHQIALTCAATTFMVSLGIGMALTVRIGQVVGARAFERVRPIAFGGFAMCVAFMSGSAIVFLTFARPIASLFTEDPALLHLAASLLVIAGFFQLVDGTQVVAMNALRGLGDVNVPMALAMFSYWLIELPACYLLAFPAGFGPKGIWSGLALGLFTASVVLSWRFLWKSSSARLEASYRLRHA